MDKIMEVFIKQGIKMLDIPTLENYSEEWLEAQGHIYQDKILPHIINEKLLRYESEY